MAHSYSFDAVTFICDGDALTSPTSIVEVVYPEQQGSPRLFVPAGAIVGFVAELVRQGRIATLENQETLEVLGVDP